MPIFRHISTLSICFICLITPFLITARQCSPCIWKIYLRFSSLHEKVWKPKITLGQLPSILLWEICSREYKTMETDEEFLAPFFLRDSDPCVATLQRSPPLWGARESSPWRQIGEDFWWPRSWRKDKAWVIAATQTGNRRGLLWWGRGERCNFQKPNYFWDGGGKYHNNNSTGDERRQGAGGDGGPVGKLRGGLKKSHSANMSELEPFLDPRTKNLAPYYGSF